MADGSPSSSPTRAGWAQRVVQWLHEPEDPSALAIFRILFGVAMAWDVYRYLAAGWVRAYYIEPEFLFKYAGFGWVEPLPGVGMYIVFGAMMVTAIGIALGAFYRFCAAFFCLAHTYVFLLEAAYYLNHAYLICLLALLLAVMPAHRALSVDAYRSKHRGRSEIPRWPRALLLAQLGIVYAYGGVAKMNADWLLRQEPVRGWMQNAARRVPLGGEIIASEPFTQTVVWGGLAFDLLIVPALLWRRTRGVAVVAAVLFHLTNAYMFNIGVFPWLMLAATTLFFDPHWPRRIPKLGRRIGAAVDSAGPYRRPPPQAQRRTAAALGLWCLVQLVVPLRHHVYPGDVAWNEEGHVAAWRMKLRSKRGRIAFRIFDPSSGRSWHVDPSEDLSPRQVTKMAGKPELIRQYAHHLAERYRAEGLAVEVHADAYVSLNYRQYRRFIDPRVDLGAEPPRLGAYPWVLPEVPPHRRPR